MTVGVLISTYNWPGALELIFISLAQQTRMPDEIIIADDGSDIETEHMINRYRAAFDFPIIHVWHEDRGFRKSLILNKAVKLATADYVIEIDGDIVPHKRFIEDHVKHAEKGRFVQGARVMLSEWKTKDALSEKILSINAFSGGINNRFNAIRVPSLSFLVKEDPYSSNNIKGCNLAFWRKDFVAINGYDNFFNGWGSEDCEFAARLIHAGITKKRLKLAAICYHLHHECNKKFEGATNAIRYFQTVKKRRTFCLNGYAQA